MYLLYYMAEATRTDWQAYYYRYNIAWGLILLNIAIQYFIKYRKNSKVAPWENAHLIWYFRLLANQAGIVFISLLIFKFTGLPISPIAMVFGMVMTICTSKVNSLVAIDFAHLAVLYDFKRKLVR